MTDPFQRLVYRLVSDDPKLIIQAFLPDLAMLRGASGTLAILRFASDEAVLRQRLRSIMPHSRQGRLEVVLVGGPDDARRLLKRATPTFQTNRVQTFHLPESGRPWRSRTSSSPVWTALTDVAEGRGPEPDWRKLHPRIERDLAQAVRQHEELAAFGQALSNRKPVATYALLAAIVLAFIVEVLLKGSMDTLVLERMGALVPRRVFAGEYYRLFSCAFLHAGTVHLLFNGYVLYALGSSLERILGTTRFLLLYGIAALAGSLASALMKPEGTSVGASGALWGLLAAEAVLAYRPGGLIPAALAEGARRAAVTNLVLNVVNSFRPQVDMSAHFGGGAAGAVLMLTGLLTAGLPRLAEQPENAEDHPPRWLKPASAFFTLCLAGGFLATVVLGIFQVE